MSRSFRRTHPDMNSIPKNKLGTMQIRKEENPLLSNGFLPGCCLIMVCLRLVFRDVCADVTPRYVCGR